MDYLLHPLLQHGMLSSTQYWHLRLLSAIAFGPLLGILYLVFFCWRKPRAAAKPAPGMWIGQDGRLFVRPTRSQTPA